MPYSLVIEGTQGARKIARGTLPRRGEWLNLDIGKENYWLEVVEIGYALSDEEILKEPENGCDFAHELATPIVFTSLALSTRTELRSKEDSYKLLLPPPRWPYGGES